MKKKSFKRLTALGLASLLLSGTVLNHTVHAEDNQPETIAQFKVDKDGSQSIVGKTTPNTRLRIEHDGIIETVSDDKGNYELKIPEDMKYEYSLNINLYAVDSENNATYTASIMADIVAPSIGDIFLEVGDTLLSSYVHDDHLENVTLRINDKVYQGKEVEEGRWDFKVPEVSEGDTVTLTATDKTGNVTEKTATVRGLEAPSATHTVDYGDAYQLIKGRTYANATVHVLLPNKTELTTTSDDTGEFKFELTEENWFYEDEGEAQIWVVRQGGFESPKKTVEKNVWPLTTIYSWYEFRVKEDGSQSLKFNGSGYGNKKITITLPNGDTVSPTKDKDGNHQIVFPKGKGLKHGQPVKVLVKSNSGKTTHTIIPDVEAPAIPVVNEIDAGDKVIGGTAEKDRGVPSVEGEMYNSNAVGDSEGLLVTLPDGKIRTVAPDEYGNWILSIPTVKNGDVIEVRAKDFVGNISEPRIIKVGFGEVKSINETDQANIQANEEQLGSSQKPVFTGKGESTLQSKLSEFPIELVPALTGNQPRPTTIQKPEIKKPAPKTTDDKKSLPNTGETSSVLAGVAGIVAASLALFTWKRKKN